MITYAGPLDDSRELIQFLRREMDKLRSLRKVVISLKETIVSDVNGDRMEFPGLTYGNPVLEELLRELGVVFNRQTLHNPAATANGVKEFLLTARWTWGHDRVL
jgi:hypothetical protein